MSGRDKLPSARPVMSLRQALYRAGRDYRGGITALALDMGVEYDALQKKLTLNSASPERWPRPEELEAIIRLTENESLLDALCRPAGAVWFRPEPVASTAAGLAELAHVLTVEGDFVRSLADGTKDGRWSRSEVEALRHHGERVVRAILGIVAGAEAAAT